MKITILILSVLVAILSSADAGLATEAGIDWHRAWHGRMMVVVWAILLPAGILAARFFKVLPWQKWPEQLDNQTWWITHQSTQYAGIVVMFFAVWLIWSAPIDENRAFLLHRWIGWIVVIAAVVQVLGGWLRGSKGGPTAPAKDGSQFGDHYNMTPRRKAFEAIHKSVGYGALGISIVAILSGLSAATAPLWMWGVLVLWWSLLAVVWVFLERHIERVETYQTIWGPDEQHPGNQKADGD